MTGKNIRKLIQDVKTYVTMLGENMNQLKHSADLCIGRVVRSNVGTYDMIVELPTLGQVQCLRAASISGTPFGYSDADMPIEGSNVLVAIDADLSTFGYVLGVVNPPTGVEQNESPQLKTTQDGPDTTTEDVYDAVRTNKDIRGFNDGVHKPADVFPGEFVRINEYGVGVDCDMLTARIRGGSSSVSASFADGAVEIVAKNFSMYDAGGRTKVVVDAGRITRESAITPYSGERKGGAGLKAKLQPNTEEYKDKRPVGKYRLQTFEGYLGGIYSCFLSRPEDCTTESESLRTVEDTTPKDVGLMHVNINDNGRLTYRSAGGIVQERTDRIPVPIRIHDPSDPKGAHAEDSTVEDVLPFDIPKDNDDNRSPHYALLALADRQAYEYKQAYARFLEVMEEYGSDKGSDFYLREEADLDPLDDDAGIPERKVEPDDLKNNVGRKSSIIMPPDGSIILRDAWGSEIVLSGGNVTINTPGSIIAAPGRSAICLAGDDVVLKARNSVDVVASEHDVSIHGNSAVKIVGGSDDNPEAGGVLIESFSASSGVDLAGSGEDAVFTGITLKATDSQITALGNTAMVGVKEELRVVSGDDDDSERTGRVTVSTGDLGVAVSGGIVASDSSGGGFTVANGGTSVVGDSVAVVAKSSVGFVTSTQIGVPLWFDSKFDMATTYLKWLAKYNASEQSDSYNKPFELTKYLGESMFTFRTSKQCGTDKGIELTDTPEHFTLYQPFWARLAKLEAGPVGKYETTVWRDHPAGGEYPWPGTDAVKNGKYAKIDGDEFANLDVKDVEVEGEDGKKTTKKVLCSKKFDSIKGEKDSEDIKVKLAGLEEYLVPDLEAK